MAALRLIPGGGKFYDHFTAMSGELKKAGHTLEFMLAPDPPVWDKAEELREIEHRCDFLTHQVYKQLHRAFAISIDREDVHAIASSLDDVMDSIEATATLVQLYKVERVRPGARELAHIIAACTAELLLAFESLQSLDRLAAHVIEVNRLEDEADRAHHDALKQLFDEEHDPIALLKWKDILDSLENTTDRCEDVADVLGGIVLKHGSAR